MHRLRGIVAISVAVFLFPAAHAPGQPDAGKPKPKAAVTLVASVDAVVPGEPFDVGLQFQLESEWHIYWKNSGQSGLPPNVTWSLPDGFTTGDLQYPIPKRHVSPGDIITNVLSGEPVLLVRVTPPESLATQRVTLTADVQYLVCKDKCLRESAKALVELPVLDAGEETKPANEDFFRRAHRALPKTSSKYLSITAATEPDELRAGERFTLLVNVNIKRGYHIQSHEPLSPSFIKSDVFLDPAGGVIYEEPAYPPPKFRTLKYVGKVSEYAGRITVRIPARLDANATPAPTRLGGIFKYQACDNKGTCFPPDAVAFEIAVRSERGAASGGVVEPTADAIADGSPPSRQAAGDALKDAGPVAAPDALPAETTEGTSAAAGELPGLLGDLGLVGLLIGCFLYGLFINATPCVLPLLSIKVLGFVQQAHESRRRTLALGLAFGTGVVVFFVILGFLASSGTNVLQYPAAVIALGAVIMALALSMLGVYTLQVPAAAATLEARIQKEGMLASFGKGALAPVLGFACTAPMLAGVFGWATQQPANIALLAFLAAGLGMASPYMLLGAFPNWLNFLPKPGPWMITFERIMGFLLLGMVVWLLHPLITQIGPVGLEWTLVFLVAIAAACWAWGRVNFNMSAARRWAYRGGAVAFVVLVGGIIYQVIYPLDEAQARVSRSASATNSNGVNDWSDIPWQLCFADTAKGTLNADGTCEHADDAFCRMCQAIWDAAWDSGIPWQRWSRQAVQDAVRSGRTAFVDFTAAYCTQCKVNKYTATNTPEVRRKMQELQVIPFQGDYTSGDEEIYSMLLEFNRPGVPLNLIYPGGKPDHPMVLPTELSKSLLLDKLEQAARDSQVASASRAGS